MPHRRDDVEFDSDGVTLRGWHYAPAGLQARAPIVVMCHGFAAVKEMCLDRYAEAFASAGCHVLCYDNRGLGASDGEPRGDLNPWQQVDDMRNAITFAEALPGVDADRVAVWGSSYSGGHVLVVGAQDRRVKCVLAQVPVVNVDANFRHMVRADRVGRAKRSFEADRRSRAAGHPPRRVKVVDPDPTAPAVLPTPDAWAWFSETSAAGAPAFVNQCTLRSAERFSEYLPGAYVRLISPTPLLMCVATEDWVTPTRLAVESFESALEPKELHLFEGGHFDAYGKAFDGVIHVQLAFLGRHLGLRSSESEAAAFR
ncbi:MAG: alpha/beta fold hydrolase [Actinobacteria bacterium]|nr:alpha/beta fold hydrolase [Actinomycetota bacterium]